MQRIYTGESVVAVREGSQPDTVIEKRILAAGLTYDQARELCAGRNWKYEIDGKLYHLKIMHDKEAVQNA